MRPAQGARRRLLAWVAWDCGSASFNVVITSVVFTVYLTGSVAADETSGSTALGIATAVAGVIIAITAPVWGQQ
jgi:UMF1 family MFS transporter